MYPDANLHEQLRFRQLRDLRQMLTLVMRENRFYQSKFREAGCLSLPATIEDFLEKFPFTRKAELVADQIAHPPYGTNLTFPINSYTRFCQTSATTGVPLRWLDTPESWAWMLNSWDTIYRNAAISEKDVVFCAFSFGPFLGFWTAFEAATRMGCLTIPGGGMSSLARLQTILANNVTVLCCTPTYAIRLGEIAGANDINLAESAVRCIVVAGEPGGSIPAVYQRIETVWPGARVIDHHGMTEIGPVSYEDPDKRGNLRIIGSGFLPEIIEVDGEKAVPSGETGELVLTNLGRWGSPLIRYRTGDLVRQLVIESDKNPDTCLSGGILGRVDDMVTIRGVNIYPGAVEEVMRIFDEINEYRVNIRPVRSMEELQVEVEIDPSVADTGKMCSQIAAALRAAFALRIPVERVEPGSLPRFEMKARRWVRHS